MTYPAHLSPATAIELLQAVSAAAPQSDHKPIGIVTLTLSHIDAHGATFTLDRNPSVRIRLTATGGYTMSTEITP